MKPDPQMRVPDGTCGFCTAIALIICLIAVVATFVSGGSWRAGTGVGVEQGQRR